MSDEPAQFPPAGSPCVSYTQTHDSSPALFKTSGRPRAALHRSRRGRSKQPPRTRGSGKKMGKLYAAVGILMLCAAGGWGRFTAHNIVACLKPGRLVIMLPVISPNPRTFCIPRVCDFPGKSLGGGAGSLKLRHSSQIQSSALGFGRVGAGRVSQRCYRVKTWFGALFSHWVRQVCILYLRCVWLRALVCNGRTGV